MSNYRYLCELKNIFMDLRARYGEDDDSVQQVKHELEAVEAMESEHQNLFARGRDHLLTRSVRQNWQGVSSLLHSDQRPRPL